MWKQAEGRLTKSRPHSFYYHFFPYFPINITHSPSHGILLAHPRSNSIVQPRLNSSSVPEVILSSTPECQLRHGLEVPAARSLSDSGTTSLGQWRFLAESLLGNADLGPEVDEVLRVVLEWIIICRRLFFRWRRPWTEIVIIARISKCGFGGLYNSPRISEHRLGGGGKIDFLSHKWFVQHLRITLSCHWFEGLKKKLKSICMNPVEWTYWVDARSKGLRWPGGKSDENWPGNLFAPKA